MLQTLFRVGGRIATVALVCSAGTASGETVTSVASTPLAAPVGAAPIAQPNTIWRFMGIPQGIQKVRDVSVNRRGNRPKLERKPPVLRIADPSNLQSPNPAIKAAAEIKQAEDLKTQKIKAIKYLATIGCGCYDKDGKITDALLAATDDCTPEVRMASIQAMQDAASGECCRKCGSTSCCNEKISKRLSEIAYERDDTGCPLESSAEIRKLAKETLCICCPGGPPSGPIEEEIPEELLDNGNGESTGAIPVPPAEEDEPQIRGESADEDDDVRGESSEDEGEAFGEDDSDEMELNDASPDESDVDDTEIEDDNGEDLVISRALSTLLDVQVGDEKFVGGMKIQPVTLVLEPAPVAQASATNKRQLVTKPGSVKIDESNFSMLDSQAGLKMFSDGSNAQPIAMPIREVSSRSTPSRRKVVAKVVSINLKAGTVTFKGAGFGADKVDASAVVYHEYLTGERLVGHLIVNRASNGTASASVENRSMLNQIRVGDRVVCR